MFPVIPANGASGAYQIANSLRFRSSASAYLNRTFGTPTGAQKGTFSFWLKRGQIATDQELMGAGASSYDQFQFQSDQIRLVLNAAADGDLRTTAVFRDPSAWYHVVLSVDTTQATAANRALIYVNGVSQALTISTNITQNVSPKLFSNVIHYIGCYAGGTTTNNLDGYMAEVNFIDGQALTPSSFGKYNATTGVWQPAKYTGSYGTNGFYLKFNNGTSTTTLGNDSSGNSNTWTTNNISLTAGSTYDWMIDSPTSYAASSYGVGNYAVLNPIAGSPTTYSNGNLNASGQSSVGTFWVATGKWYWEAAVTSGITGNTVTDSWAEFGVTDGISANGFGYISDGEKENSGRSAFGATWTNGDIIGVALDAGAKSLTFYKNGTSQGSFTFSSTSTIGYTPWMTPRAAANTYVYYFNFGQRPFSYTPPSGFKALNTQNLPTPTIFNGAGYMAATTYTGTLLSNSITNSGGFQPDLVWIKSRSAATDNKLTDSVRGVTKGLISNTTDAETTDTTGLTAFNSSGFTLGTSITYNNLAATYIAWQWKANGTAVTNSTGTITSQVSANTTAGFSVVTYTGTGANATVGHGLGVAPSMVIVKTRSASGQDWQVYHTTLGQNQVIQLDATSAAQTLTNYWYNGVTSSVFGINGTYAGINGNGNTYVAYCFAAIAGYSAFGSYTGNGSTDGPFVYCGFQPRFVLIKLTSASTDGWLLQDTTRFPYNVITGALVPNSSGAESSFATGFNIDVLSNGFKLRNSGSWHNGSGSTYIYAAFASSPFKNSLAF